MKAKYFCSRCGGTDVQIKAWVYANTDEIANDCDDGEAWCDNCDDETDIVTVYDVEMGLKYATFDKEDKLENGFYWFEEGTPRKNILEWIEENK